MQIIKYHDPNIRVELQDDEILEIRWNYRWKTAYWKILLDGKRIQQGSATFTDTDLMELATNKRKRVTKDCISRAVIHIINKDMEKEYVRRHYSKKGKVSRGKSSKRII